MPPLHRARLGQRVLITDVMENRLPHEDDGKDENKAIT